MSLLYGNCFINKNIDHLISNGLHIPIVHVANKWWRANAGEQMTGYRYFNINIAEYI